MAASTDGTWTCLAPSDETLRGEGFAVTARTQDRADELWVRVEAPDGSWRYLVIDSEGEVLVSEGGQRKRDAFVRALEARVGVHSG